MRRPLIALTSFVALIICLSECASGGSTASTASTATAPAGRPNPDVITAAEMAKSTGQNAYEIIKELRPRFLQSRGATAPGAGAYSRQPLDPVVYFDERRLGSFDELSQIVVSQISEIRHFNSSEATARWGTGHSAGAILILSKKKA
jgi:hypothetical protein